MKTVTLYEAYDGKRFIREADCLEYEQQMQDAKAANEMLANGATLMAVLTRANRKRPWWDRNLILEDRDMLIRMTKDTGITVEHWQCRKTPGYKVSEIGHTGCLYLHCEAGAISGAFGCWVSLPDFLRYAKGSLENYPAQNKG
jgi:hypothetical protein